MKQSDRITILVVLFIGVLMRALDIAIAGPALPAIRSQFAVSDRLLAWMFSIYVLFNLVGIPLMAKLSDQFDRRSIIYSGCDPVRDRLAGGGAFAQFWFCAGWARYPGVWRGGISPVASAVIGDTFPPEKRGRALGLIGAVFGLAFLVSPLLALLLKNHSAELDTVSQNEAAHAGGQPSGATIG